MLFDITKDNPTACPACVKIENKYWCGIIKDPVKWLSQMVGNVEWKCEAMAEIAMICMGIGEGCSVNPSVQEIMGKLTMFSQQNVEQIPSRA